MASRLDRMRTGQGPGLEPASVRRREGPGESISARGWLVRGVPVLLVLVAVGRPARGDELRYGAPRTLAVLENRAIRESSGLAVSRTHRGLFWTHNDSGDRPRVFAFDEKGADWGDYRVPGSEAVDWEDMCSLVLDGTPYLLLGDVGDNPQRRPFCTLYLVREPRLRDAVARVERTIRFRYENGPRNCEALGVDPQLRQILLVSKTTALRSTVYALDLPDRDPAEPLTASAIATVSLPLVTAMDISPDGRRAIVLTYGHAYEYTRAGRASWGDAFREASREITMPTRNQGESICYGADGKTLYLTSERVPTPFWKVPAQHSD